MSPTFDDAVDAEGMAPRERERLQHVHDLLVQAGPPSELPASLATLPEPGSVVRFPQTRRRIAVGLAFAAALAAAAFGAGYVVGDRGGDVDAVRVVGMQGTGARGLLHVGAPDESGNWPITFTVRGLPEQNSDFAYYELFVVHKGKPAFPCGGFRVQAGHATEISFFVPYTVKNSTRWVVTAVDRKHRWPGRVVMT